MTTPQPHAELAARYFADVTLKCWARDKDSNDKWDLLHSPLFISQDVEYYVGHEPPPPMVEMNDKTNLVADALPERDTTKTAEQQGLFRKFDVRRVDGSDQLGGKHHGCRYYVIDVDHDPYAAAALGAYADACKESHPELARDLREKWGAADTVEKLRAEKDRLTTCLEKASASAEHFERKCHLRGNEIDTLRAQLAEAQRDADRLDWIIEHRAYVVSDPDCCDGYWLNYARPDGTTWTQATEHETPRAAIDAAKGEPS